jgi:hypothetical protein
MPNDAKVPEWGPERLDAEANRIIAGMLRFSGGGQKLAYFKVELAKIPEPFYRSAVETLILGRESIMALQLQEKDPKPDLTASLIILLISAAITIFVFWISSQYLGQENFTRLPDWIVGTYKGVWSSAVTGTAGIGLALVKAFTSRGRPQPHYLKYIGITTACLLVPIAVIVLIPAFVPQVQGRKLMQPPAGVARIDSKSTAHTDFDLEAQPQTVPVRYVLKGSFAVANGKLTGHLASGRVNVAKELPKAFPDAITRISFRACYLGPVNGVDQMTVYPDNPKSRDSIEVKLALTPGASYDLPSGDFAFELPEGKNLDRSWLCAALWNGIGYFPAQ